MSEEQRKLERGYAAAGEAIAGFVGTPHGGRTMRITYVAKTGQFRVRCGVGCGGACPAKPGNATNLPAAVIEAIRNFDDWVNS